MLSKVLATFFLTFFLWLIDNLFFICPLQYKKGIFRVFFSHSYHLSTLLLFFLPLDIVLVLLIFFELISFFFVMLCLRCFIFETCIHNVVLIVFHLQYMHLILDGYLIFCIFFFQAFVFEELSQLVAYIIIFCAGVPFATKAVILILLLFICSLHFVGS